MEEELSLRDHFAIAALTGLLAYNCIPNDLSDEEKVVRSYKLADLMLKERQCKKRKK